MIGDDDDDVMTLFEEVVVKKYCSLSSLNFIL